MGKNRGERQRSTSEQHALPASRSNTLDSACDAFGLTQRQRQVFALILQGGANKDVARELGCSVKNAEYLVSQILRKAGCSSRLELAAKVLERHLQVTPTA